MRKLLLSFSLSVLALAGINEAKANPGDTTWVQANKVNLDYYNNFDAHVQFPDGSKTYRQVLEVFTLGEYTCPSGSQYCHQWDYTVTNYIMTPGGDTAELSRFITPYANTGVPRFPSTWSSKYVFDVTDFCPIMKDSAVIRLNYSGYSGGFTANVRFAFIEGVPPRNVLGIQRAWSNSYTYGNAADPIGNHVTPYAFTAPANTKYSELKVTVTGHGADATDNCCEFSNNNAWHSYSVAVNGNTTATALIYRDDCGSNELYPQGGTWIYNRANWCPGALVHINSHVLPVSSGSYALGLNFSSYTSSGSYGSFSLNGEVIYYDQFNHAKNASITEVVSPNNDKNYFRENPSASTPVVRIRNTGSDPVTSVLIEYGVKDSVPVQYTWNGTLNSMEETTVQLPELNTLTSMSQHAISGNFQFVAHIISVNGAADEDNSDDNISSVFTSAPVWPNKLVLVMKTNTEGVNGLNISPSETSWQITDMNGNVVASRTNAAVTHLYNDTVNIPNPGFYKLSILDGGCDGLHWWVWDQNPSYGVTAGSFTVKRTNGSSIPMNGYSYGGTYNNDFGCSFIQNFSVAAQAGTSGVQSLASAGMSMDLFPSPAKSTVWIRLELTVNTNSTLTVIDVMGRTVLQQTVRAEEYNTSVAVDVQQLPAGLYQFVLQNGNTKVSKSCSIVR